MTYEKALELQKEIPALTTLFAGGVGAAMNDPKNNLQSSGLINYKEGIPIQYATNLDLGGKHVLRGDINAIGNIASREIMLRQRGGYHTFDQRVCDIIGGYGFGAILDWYQEDTQLVRKVRCVKTGGNCTTPIDDPVNGVNGSGTRYWAIVDIYDELRETIESAGEDFTMFDESRDYQIPAGTYGLSISNHCAISFAAPIFDDITFEVQTGQSGAQPSYICHSFELWITRGDKTIKCQIPSTKCVFLEPGDLIKGYVHAFYADFVNYSHQYDPGERLMIQDLHHGTLHYFKRDFS